MAGSGSNPTSAGERRIILNKSLRAGLANLMRKSVFTLFITLKPRSASTDVAGMVSTRSINDSTLLPVMTVCCLARNQCSPYLEKEAGPWAYNLQSCRSCSKVVGPDQLIKLTFCDTQISLSINTVPNIVTENIHTTKRQKTSTLLIWFVYFHSESLYSLGEMSESQSLHTEAAVVRLPCRFVVGSQDQMAGVGSKSATSAEHIFTVIRSLPVTKLTMVPFFSFHL